MVAFSEEQQRLLGLNPGAALVVRELQSGLGPAEITRRLMAEASVGPDVAAEWVGGTIDALRHYGMIAGEPASPLPAGPAPPADPAADLPPYAPFRPWAEQRYQLLGTCVLVRFGCHPQKRRLDLVIGHLAIEDARPADVIIDLPTTWSTGGPFAPTSIVTKPLTGAPTR